MHDAARAGVTYVNASESEPLEILRYFGPEVNPDAPGDRPAKLSNNLTPGTKVF